MAASAAQKGMLTTDCRVLYGDLQSLITAEPIGLSMEHQLAIRLVGLSQGQHRQPCAFRLVPNHGVG
jgi:hypothetical protein